MKIKNVRPITQLYGDMPACFVELADDANLDFVWEGDDARVDRLDLVNADGSHSLVSELREVFALNAGADYIILEPR